MFDPNPSRKSREDLLCPYLLAHSVYTSEDREIDWTTALDAHHQLGAVISLPDVFLMARPVDAARPDDHLSIFHHLPGSDCWHVWCVAGSVPQMIEIARSHGVRSITYQRHGEERVRRRVL